MSPDNGSADRRQRLSEAVGQLRTRGSFDLGRAQLYIGGMLVIIGVLTIILGWWAASRTPFLFEQIPYTISGGALGLALAFLGGFLYFAHWVSQLLNETRAQTERTNELLQALLDRSPNGTAKPKATRRKARR